MSAYDDEWGCGEYTCLRCFNGQPPEDAGPFGNAWLDEEWRLTPAGKRQTERRASPQEEPAE